MQVQHGLAADIISTLGIIARTSSLGAITIVVVLSYAMKLSLNFLWGMINAHQILVHVPILNVRFPGNAMLFYHYLIIIAKFDYIPTDDYFTEWFALGRAEPYSQGLENCEYGSMFMVYNMGTLFFVFFFYLLLYIVLALLHLFNLKTLRAYEALKRQLVWSWILRFLLEGCLEIAIFVCLNAIHFEFDSFGQRLSFAMAVFFGLALLVGLPVLLVFLQV